MCVKILGTCMIPFINRASFGSATDTLTSIHSMLSLTSPQGDVMVSGRVITHIAYLAPGCKGFCAMERPDLIHNVAFLFLLPCNRDTSAMSQIVPKLKPDYITDAARHDVFVTILRRPGPLKW
jgi:hypothetical protein